MLTFYTAEVKLDIGITEPRAIEVHLESYKDVQLRVSVGESNCKDNNNNHTKKSC